MKFGEPFVFLSIKSGTHYWHGCVFANCIFLINQLWPSDAIGGHKTGSMFVEVMACCLTAPSHYLNQCCLHVEEVMWHSPQSNFMGVQWVWKYTFRIDNVAYARGQRVNWSYYISVWTGTLGWLWIVSLFTYMYEWLLKSLMKFVGTLLHQIPSIPHLGYWSIPENTR